MPACKQQPANAAGTISTPVGDGRTDSEGFPAQLGPDAGGATREALRLRTGARLRAAELGCARAAVAA
jgi:hypothetical protein